MALLFFPFLILFFITAKMVYFYLACIMLIPIVISPLFESLGDFVKGVGGSDEFKTGVKWVAFSVLATSVYFLMHS